MSLDHLWAGWRLPYLEGTTGAAGPSGASTSEVRPPPAGSGSLFERILRLDDAEGYIVHRSALASALLNAYPYTNGHVLVVPNRAVATLDQLDGDEHAALWAVVRDSAAALTAAYGCDGLNIGMNIGAAGGAGVPDHLHAHVLPRWAGDTNFMTAVANTRVMPESLDATWHKLRDAWPAGT